MMNKRNGNGVLQACIFDLDGVLVDTAPYHYKAWKRLANELGFDFNEEQNEHLKGISRIDSLNIILNWGGVTLSEVEKEQMAIRKNTWYLDMIRNMQPDEVLPGAFEFLSAVRSTGLKCALGSASRNSSTILKATGLTAYFDAIVDGNTVTESKPDPKVFLTGAELLEVPPANCVVFEDGIAGVQAAKAAGMKVVGIGNDQVLELADVVVTGLDKISLPEIKNIFEREDLV